MFQKLHICSKNNIKFVPNKSNEENANNTILHDQLLLIKECLDTNNTDHNYIRQPAYNIYATNTINDNSPNISVTENSYDQNQKQNCVTSSESFIANTNLEFKTEENFEIVQSCCEQVMVCTNY